MSDASPAHFDFGSRADRGYDHEAVEQFPWPVVAAYDDIHRWMDQGLAVHAAWQIRDVWEGLLRFLATVAAADSLQADPADEDRTSRLLAKLLKPQGLSLGDWAKVLELTLKAGPCEGARIPGLADLLYRRGTPTPLLRALDGSESAFVHWRNHRFGHGVFQQDTGVYGREALGWMERLHDAYDDCRELFAAMQLDSDGPDGQPLTWGNQTPLSYFHGHQPASGETPLLTVRLQAGDTGPLELTPLLSVQRCSVCGQWAAFYLDKHQHKPPRTRFLDFVLGHSQNLKNLTTFTEWADQVRAADAEAAAARAAADGERTEPDPERFPNFLHEFEPPVYLAEQIAGFMRQQDRGVIHLSGPAGIGKSWAGRGLEHSAMLPGVLGRAVSLLHVSLHGPQTPTAADVQTQLDRQAREQKRWQVPAEPQAPSPALRWAGWLTALMRTNIPGDLLITIDGLDELPADSDVPDLFPPAEALPEHCYLVFTSRPQLRTAAAAATKRLQQASGSQFLGIELGPDRPEHRATLQSYISKRLARPRLDGQPPLPADWTKPLIDLTGGSFLYAAHYCDALRFGVYENPDSLPQPEDYYPGFFGQLRGRVGDELFEQWYARTLALLAVAREPVGLTHLTAWGLERGRLMVVLDDLAPLLAVRRQPWDGESLYSLGHDAIRQFLAGDAAWQQRLAAADESLARKAVYWFGDDWSAADPFDPVEGYLLRHVLEHAQGTPLEEQLKADAGLPRACVDHAVSLGEMRNLGYAVSLAGVAIRQYKQLIDQEERYKLRADLAMAYGTQGNALLQQGQLSAALDSLAACISLYEHLINQERQHELRPALASAYSNQGSAQLQQGRPDEALKSFAAHSTIIEQLVKQEPWRERRPDLASAYMNQGTALLQQGRLDAALDSIAFCITLYKQLERHMLRPKLALAYMNQGTALAQQGRLDEALESYADCIQIYQELVQEDGQDKLRSDLAGAIMNRVNIQLGLGRFDEALNSSETSVALYEELVHRKGRRELRPDLAMARGNRGNALAQQGRLDEALQSYASCIRLYEQLVYQEGRAELRPDLANAIMNRGVELARQGWLNEALKSFAMCLTLFEQLVHQEERWELAGDLGRALVNRANAELDVGHFPMALRTAEKAVTILLVEVTNTGRSGAHGDLAAAVQVLRRAEQAAK